MIFFFCLVRVHLMLDCNREGHPPLFGVMHTRNTYCLLTTPTSVELQLAVCQIEPLGLLHFGFFLQGIPFEGQEQRDGYVLLLVILSIFLVAVLILGSVLVLACRRGGKLCSGYEAED